MRWHGADESQLELDLTSDQPLPDVEHPVVVLRWLASQQRVEVLWPEFRLSATFATWQDALDNALHPLNIDRVRIKVWR